MIDLYNKENLFAEFAMQKTNADKVKFLQDIKFVFECICNTYVYSLYAW